MNVAPSKKVNVYVVSDDDNVRTSFERSKVFFKTLAHASEVYIKDNKETMSPKIVAKRKGVVVKETMPSIAYLNNFQNDHLVVPDKRLWTS